MTTDGMTTDSIVQLAAMATALTGVAIAARRLPRTGLVLTWAAFCLSVFCAMAAGLLDGFAPGPALGLAMAGSAGCGWFWLFARCLFRTGRAVEPRHVAVVAAIMAPAVIYYALDGTPGWDTGLRMLANFQMLVSSTVLVLAFWEPVRALSSVGDQTERRFRFAFLGAYGVSLAVAVLWPSYAAEGTVAATLRPSVEAFFSMAFVVIAGFAARYRLRHPLTSAALQAEPDLSSPANREPAAPSDEDRRVAAMITALMDRDRIFLDPALKIGALAERIGEPEYKVSRAITGVLGRRNFNQLINAYRIETAKAHLADPARDDLSILTISWESGFGSVGPFNRAFKAATGQTPREYRAAARATRDDPEAALPATS